MRNPLLTLKGASTQFIGDPHLGRRFSTGIPLEKRGEFEKKQLLKFRDLLQTPCALRIIGGDLFDKAKVDETDLINVYVELRLTDPRIPIYILQGNHDDSKNERESTSFDVLELLLQSNPHIVFVRDHYLLSLPEGPVLLVGWQFNKSIQEKMENVNVDTIVTHLDRINYGSGHNTLPYEFLKKKGVKLIINGHEHLPWQGVIFPGINYIGIGSMLPYDPSQQHPTDEPLFIDLAIENYDPEQDLSGLMVRLYVDDLSNVPDIPEALSVRIVKRSQIEEVKILEVKDYSVLELLQTAATETGLSEDLVHALHNELNEAAENA